MHRIIPVLAAALFIGSASPHAEGTWYRYTGGNTIYDVVPDGAVLWCGTSGGVSRFHPDTGVFRRFGIEHGLPGVDCPRAARHPDGRILAISGGDVAAYDGSVWYSLGLSGLEDSPKATDLAVDAAGTVWVCSFNGIYRLEEGTWERFDLSRITSIAAGRGTVWAVRVSDPRWKVAAGESGTTSGAAKPAGDPTYTSALYRFDGGGWVEAKPFSASHSSSWTVEAGGGKVYAWQRTTYAHDFQGLHVWDGYAWNTVRLTDGLPSHDIRSVTPLPDGSAWVVTSERISRLRITNKFEIETLPMNDDTAARPFLSLSAADDGSLWVGTDNGLSRWDGDAWDTWRTPSVAGKYLRYAAEDSTGSIWFGGDEGLSSYYNGEWTLYTAADVLPDEGIRCIKVDRDGGVWVAAGSNLGLFSDGAWRWWNGVECTHMALDGKGTLFVAGGGKLLRFDGSRMTELMSGNFNQLVTDRGGTMWAVKKAAAGEYDLVKCAGTSATTFSTLRGANDTFRQLAFDGRGRLWVVVFNEVHVLEDGAWTGYTLADGLLHNTAGIGFDRDGTPWSRREKMR